MQANLLTIDPAGIYDDGALVLSLGLTHAALADARRQGDLRFRRVGRRVIYTGRALLDWLESHPAATVPASARQEAGR